VVIWVVLVLCIDSCILFPLGVYLAFPRRADALLATGKAWLIGHQRAVAGGSAGVFGVLLLGQGIVALA
jgi:Sap, sulfolipid-1-addressing protein